MVEEKRSESGMISEPITVKPTASIGEVRQLMASFHISGVRHSELVQAIDFLWRHRRDDERVEPTIRQLISAKKDLLFEEELRQLEKIISGPA